MIAGTEDSDFTARAAGAKSDSLSFRTLDSGRFTIALLGAFAAFAALLVGSIFILDMYSAEHEITDMVAVLMGGAMLAGIVLIICVLQFVVIRKWVTQRECITWIEAGFESRLHGTVACNDIRSYRINTFDGARVLTLQTVNGKIRYMLNPEPTEVFAALAQRMSLLVDDYNDGKWGRDERWDLIGKSTFFESTLALVLAIASTLVAVLFLLFPLGTPTGIFLLGVMACGACGLWVNIFNARAKI